jgi:hypothetical protein
MLDQALRLAPLPACASNLAGEKKPLPAALAQSSQRQSTKTVAGS